MPDPIRQAADFLTGTWRGVFFDIDGTLLTAGRLCPGAAELLAELRRRDFPHFLLTNDANHSREEKSGLMRRAGLPVAAEEIVSAGSALAGLVRERGWAGKPFLVLGDMGDPSFVENAGLETRRELELEQVEACFGIIVGEGYYDWHNYVQTAVNFLRRHPDRPLVVPNPDVYWPGRYDGFGLGAGAVGRFIPAVLREMGTEISPVFLGKPCEPIYRFARETMTRKFALTEPPPFDSLLMIGDSLKSDITGANRAGMGSALVLTGITSRAEAERAEGDERPDRVFESLLHL